MSGTLIIAEAGIAHNGKLDTALRLCDAAKAAGADIVKFQTYKIHKLMRRSSPDFMKLGNLSLPIEAFQTIAQHCENIGIEFMSTPDDVDSLNELVEHCGMKRIKLGSGSLLYEPLVDAAFDTGLPVLLSTGMATLDQVADVVKRQHERRKPAPGKVYRQFDLTLMHCVSLYPCPPHLANVGAIIALQHVGDEWDESHWEMVNWYNHRVGYSDHTIGNYAILSAVALGAAVVEKHFTLDNEAEGPDHRMSAMPEQFDRMVMKIRQTEVVLGHGRKEPSPEELAMIPRIRKDAEGFQPGL